MDKKNVQNIYPLTDSQQGMLFHYLQNPNAQTYVETMNFELESHLEFNQEAFCRAWQMVQQQHEVLRTVFRWKKIETPLQIVLKDHPLQVEVIDLRDEDQGRGAKIQEILKTIHKKPFDLERECARLWVIQKTQTTYSIVLTNHHILLDGWSTAGVVADFFQAYDCVLGARALQLAPRPPFANYVKYLSKTDRQAAKAFWKDALSQMDCRVQGGESGFQRSIQRQVLDAGTLQGLNTSLKQHKITFASVVNAAYLGFIHGISQEKTITVGNVVSGRQVPIPGIERMSGLLINTLPLSVTCESGQTLKALCDQVADKTAKRSEFEHYSLIDIQRDCGVGPGEMLFDALVVVENYPIDLQKLKSSHFKVVGHQVIEENHYPITLTVMAQETLSIEINFDPGHISENLIKQCLQWMTLLFTDLERYLNTPILDTYSNYITRAIHLCANFIADPVEEAFRGWMVASGLPYRLHFEDYNQVIQSIYHRITPGPSPGPTSPYFYILLRLEGQVNLKQYCSQILEGLKQVPAHHKVMLILCDDINPRPTYNLDTKNDFITALQALNHVQVVDMGSHWGFHGLQETYDPAKDAVGHMPLTDEAYHVVGTQMARMVIGPSQKPYKVIAVDCDNTLWQGIVGEDGVDGLVFTKDHLALQAYLISCQQAGVLLVLASKNNEADIWEVFDKRSDLLLKREHLTGGVINWESKADNLKRLAQTLNLGLDSFVFIDDNPKECSEMRQYLPQVLTLQVPADMGYMPVLLHHLWALDQGEVTQEDSQRTAMYRAEMDRMAEREKVSSIDDFLVNLGLQVHLYGLEVLEKEDQGPTIARFAQLTKRTNQFNLNGIVVAEGEIMEAMEDPKWVQQVLYVSDCFGEYGITGALRLQRDAGVLVVESLLMSCRVLGRGIEGVLLYAIGQCALEMGLASVRFQYRDNKKNQLVRTMLDEVGDEIATQDLVARYPLPPYIALHRDAPLVAAKDADASTPLGLDAGNLQTPPAEPLTNGDQAQSFGHFKRLDGMEKALQETPEGIGVAQALAYLPLALWHCHILADWVNGGFQTQRKGLYGLKGFFEKRERKIGASESQLSQGSQLAHRGGLGGERLSEDDPLVLQMLEIYRSLLGLEGFGLDDNFFTCGGHSLKATQLIGRISKRFDLQLDLEACFNYPTVRSLSHYMMGLMGQMGQMGQRGTVSQAPPLQFATITPAPRGDLYPLTKAQERIYVLQMLDSQKNHYNMPALFEVEGALDRQRLAHAFVTLIRRHESLRTRFISVDGLVGQEILEGDALENLCTQLYHSLAHADLEVVDSQGILVAFDHFVRGFDLENGPLVRLEVLRIEGGDQGPRYGLMFDAHHIILDGVSTAKIWADLFSLYRGSLDLEREVALDIHYKDYAVFEAAGGLKPVYSAAKAYWMAQFSDIPQPLMLPTRGPRPSQMSMDGATLERDLGPELVDKIQGLCGRYQLTPYMVYELALALLLRQYTMADVVSIGTPVSGRTHPQTQDMVGMFVNTLVLQHGFDQEMTLLDRLVAHRGQLIEAFGHQSYPFEALVSDVKVPRDLSRNPLFDVMFSYLDGSMSDLVYRDDQMAVRAMPTPGNTAKVDMSFTVLAGEQTRVQLNFATALFQEDMVSRILDHYVKALEQLAGEVDLEVATGLTFGDEGICLRGALATPEESQVPVLKQLEALAVEMPQVTAIIECSGSKGIGRELTYRAFYDAVVRRSGYYKALGLGPDQRVGLLCQRSVDLVVAQYALLGLGAAFVPLGLDYPRGRMVKIAEDAGLSCLLVGADLDGLVEEAVAGFEAESGVLCHPLVGESTLEGGQEALALAQGLYHKDQIAYMLFTSGSTGVPKGVCISHDALLVRMAWFGKDCYELGARILFKTAYTFDVCISEIFGFVAARGSLVVLPEGDQRDGYSIARALEGYDVNYVNFTPSAFGAMGHGLYSLKPRALKAVILAGEALTMELAKNTLKAFKEHETLHTTKLINLYGPTEATVYASGCEIRETTEKITIGGPIDDAALMVVDSQFNAQPLGAIGELVIGGRGLALGYVGQEALSADRFVVDSKTGESWYKTGDLARILANGEVEYLGRNDAQVKLRGYRIELGEIARVMEQVPGVNQAVVQVIEVLDTQMLCAYGAIGKKLDGENDIVTSTEQGLRAYLSAHLPSYMVPDHYVILEALPLSSSGKVQYRALPMPNLTPEDLGSGGLGKGHGVRLEPQGSLETTLYAIFEKVLGITSPFSTDDDFFELGGNSLKANQCAARIAQAFGVQISIVQLFKTPTVVGLGAYVGSCLDPLDEVVDNASGTEGIMPCEAQDSYPLSSMQRRFYVLQQLAPQMVTNNMPIVVPISNGIPFDRIQDGFLKLMERHEILRTEFVQDHQEVRQRVLTMEAAAINFEIVEIGVEGIDQDEATIQWLGSLSQPFDLGKGPLMRVKVIRPNRQGDRSLLYVDMHHIIGDGESLKVLFTELHALLSEPMGLGAKALGSVNLQYRDFVLWQQTEGAQVLATRDLNYWLKRLEKVNEPLNLAVDWPRPAIQRHSGSEYKFHLDEGFKAGFDGLRKATGTTAFMLMYSALVVVLAKNARQNVIALGTPVSGRTQPPVIETIGPFINTLPLAIDLEPLWDMSIQGYLQHVRAMILEDLEHQHAPFEAILDHMALERDLSRNPLYDVMLTVEDYPKKHAWTLPTPAKVDLTFMVNVEASGLEIVINYANHLFAPWRISQFCQQWVAVLGQMIDEIGFKQAGQAIQPLKTLGSLSLIHPKAIRDQYLNYAPQVVALWEGPYAPEKGTVIWAFMEQVERTPEAAALVFEGKTLTYSQLLNRTLGFAQHLLNLGLSKGTTVGILFERSMEMHIAMMASLYIGAIFVPLDPKSPQGRLAYIVDNAELSAIIAHSKTLEVWEDTLKSMEQLGEDRSLQVIHFDEKMDWEAPANPPNIPALKPACTDQSMAYIIYTSGSTGNPKGVQVPHIGYLNFCKWIATTINLSSSDKMTKMASFTFDASLLEFFPPLISGASIHILSQETVESVTLLRQYIRQNHITVSFMITQLCELLLGSDAPEIKDLRVLLTGGDKLKTVHSGDFDFYNMYGPTEYSIVTTFQKIADGDSDCSSISIGKPVWNTEVLILDEALGLQPVGTPGELCISGLGIAAGYVKDPELTAEKFIPHPLKPGERMYRTGDLARRLADGSHEFLGRMDHQVKLRGYRIELGEIEGALMKCQGVKEASVVLSGTSQGGQLVAFVVLEDGQDEGCEGIKVQLRASIPHYMVPSALIALRAMPLTQSGKIDRKVLGTLASEEGSKAAFTGGDAHGPEPTNPREEKILELWRTALGNSKLNVESDFFEQGGHSLKAMAILNHYVELGLGSMGLADFYSRPTPRLQAAYFETLNENYPQGQGQGLTAAPARAHYPLTKAQERIYVLQMLDPKMLHYNMPARFEVEGPLDVDRLGAAFIALVKRHESLRTHFTMVDGLVRQVIISGDALEALCQEITEGLLVKKVLDGDFVRPFDLERGPLVRLEIVEIQENQGYELLFDAHHIILDGVSVVNIWSELFSLYHGGEDALAPLDLHYKDYAVFESEGGLDQLYSDARAYWLDQFAELPEPLALPTKGPRPPHMTTEGATIELVLGSDLVEKVGALGKRYQLTPYMIYQLTLALLLHQYTQSNVITMGTPVSGRSHYQTKDMVGMFVNTLVLKHHFDQSMSLLKRLLSHRDYLTEAFSHQSYPFEALVAESKVPRDLSRNPLFDVLFSYLDGTMGSQQYEDEAIRVCPVAMPMTTAKFDMSFTLVEAASGSGSGIKVLLNYAVALFDKETAQAMLNHYGLILEQLVAVDLEETLALDLSEVGVCLKGNLATEEETSLSVISQLEKLAHEIPNQTALVDAQTGKTLTYSQFYKGVVSLCGYYSSLGIGPNHIVGLLSPRSVDLVLAQYALLGIGAAFVPFGLDYPKARMAHIAEDANLRAVLIGGGLEDAVEDEVAAFSALTGIRCHDLICESDLARGEAALRDGSNHYDQNQVAYMLFTSGSTGVPKGVIISHEALLVRMAWFGKHCYDHGARILYKTAYTFDVCISEIFGFVAAKGTLVVLPEGEHRDGYSIAKAIEQYDVAYVNYTPSAYAAMQHSLYSLKPKALKAVILAGEALSMELSKTTLEAFKQHETLKGTKLVNLYGPTEATVYASGCEINEVTEKITIGGPIDDTALMVVDSNFKMQPFGAIGELVIGGRGLALGYVNQATLTAERFVIDPQTGHRWYKTGDLARILANGQVDYLGRNDSQVKVRGYRIELGEIARIMEQVPQVNQAVVRVIQVGETQLICGFAAIGELANKGDAARISTEENLRAFLSAHLPTYMLPDHLVILDALPLSASGKVQYSALPLPIGNGGLLISEKKTTITKPQTPIEGKLYGIFETVLNLKIPFGIEEDFFDLGGNSLKANSLAHLVRRTFSVDLPLRVIFSHGSIKDLAAWIVTSKQSNLSGDFMVQRALMPAPLAQTYPLTRAQERIYLLQMLDPQMMHYNMPSSFEVRGPLDLNRLCAAFVALVKRHESLRTTFIMDQDSVRQVIATGEALEDLCTQLAMAILAPKSVSQVEGIHKGFIRPFDLEKGPLIRLEVLEIEENNRYQLLFDAHHIILDGVSMAKVWSELFLLYEGGEETLPPLELHYKDYAVFESEGGLSEIYSTAKAYWLDQFAQLPEPLALPIKGPRPKEMTTEGATLEMSIHPELIAKVSAFSSQHQLTPYMVYELALAITLHQCTASHVISIGTPVSGRSHYQTQEMVGMFVNTVVLKHCFDKEMPLSQRLLAHREHLIQAFSHQSYPFEALVIDAKVPRDLSRNPLFDVLFSYIDSSMSTELYRDDQIWVRAEEVLQETAKFDLSYTVVAGETTKVMLNYQVALFDQATAGQLLNHYYAVLDQLVGESAETLIQPLKSLVPQKAGTHFDADISAKKAQENAVVRLPKNEVEQKLYGIFQEVLAIKRVFSTEDDFFELGGNSLKANTLAHIVRREFSIDLPLKTVFRDGTIRGLGAWIQGGMQGEKGSGSDPLLQAPLKPASPAQSYPLTRAQERIYVLQMLDPQMTHYNMPATLEVVGPLDVRRFANAFVAVLKRHESLRTRFKMVDGAVRQVVIEGEDLDVLCAKLSQALSSPKKSRGGSEAYADFVRPFDLENDLLVRLEVVELEEKGGYELHFDAHHIILDGVSIGKVWAELFRFYSEEGALDSLPALDLHYKDYAVFEAEGGLSEMYKAAKAYWLDQFSQVPDPLALPTRGPRPSQMSTAGATLEVALEGPVVGQVEALASRYQLTPYMVYELALALLLHQYTQADLITIGTPVSGRSHYQTQDMIGMFVNTLVLKHQFHEKMPLAQRLMAHRDHLIEAFSHQSYPFEALVTDSKAPRDLSRNPLFDVLFSYLDKGMAGQVYRDSNISVGAVEKPMTTAKFDLSLAIMAGGLGAETKVVLNYALALFDEQTAQGLLDHYQIILGQLVSVNLEETSSLSLCEAGLCLEGALALEEETGVPVIGQLEKLAKEMPNQEALIDAQTGNSLTYSQFYAKVVARSGYYRSLGIQSNHSVGLLCPRSVDLVVAQYALMGLGAAFVPLGLDYPKARMEKIAEDANLTCLLVGPELEPSVEGEAEAFSSHTGIPCHRLTGASTLEEGDEALKVAASHYNKDQIAYMLFTSGSTGVPKGVMISHDALLVRMAWFGKDCYEGGARILFKTAYTFDVCISEIFGFVAARGTLVVLPEGEHRDGYSIARAIEAYHVGYVNYTSSAFAAMQHSLYSLKPQGLKAVILAGEALSLDLARGILAAFKAHETLNQTKLVNLYGPTEATVYASGCEITEETEKITIGGPLDDTALMVVDAQFNQQPVGAMGELVIGGRGLALGYVNQEALSAERFVVDPKTGKRWYKTGDLARILANGQVEYLGRNDSQVKVRGYRIELGEIARVMEQIRGVDQAVVQVMQVGETQHICGFAALGQEESALTEGALRTYLSAHLPTYMVPDHFVLLKALPLSASGKVQYRDLPFPQLDGDHGDQGTQGIQGIQGASKGALLKPLNAVEEKLYTIFESVLGLTKPFSTEDDFFELGGNSLKANYCAVKMAEAFGVQVSIVQIFKTPTVVGLGAHLMAASAVSTTTTSTIGDLSLRKFVVGGPIQDPQDYPLSPIQKRFYVLQQLAPEMTAYNMPFILKLDDHTSHEQVEWALRQLMVRHQILRSQFVQVGSEVRQCPIPVDQLDSRFKVGLVSALEISRSGGLEGWLVDQQRPFDLSQGPLMRGNMLETEANGLLLHMDLHHIIGDGESLKVLYGQLVALLNHPMDKEPEFTATPQYSDIVLWQQQEAFKVIYQADLNYWINRLSPFTEPLNLVTDYPRPALQSHTGKTYRHHGPAHYSQGLSQLKKHTQTTNFMVLYGAVTWVLSQNARQSALVVGSPVSGRTHGHMLEAIGPFLNTLPLAIDFDGFGHMSVADFLKNMGHQIKGDLEHQSVPFEALLDYLNLERDLSRNPLYDVLLTVEEVSDYQPGPLEDLDLAQTAKVDLTFNFVVHSKGIEISVNYGSHLYAPWRIEGLCQQILEVLDQWMTLDIHASALKDIRILSKEGAPKAYDQYKLNWIDPIYETTLHQFFAQAQKTPHAPAMVCGEESLTYEDLAAAVASQGQRLLNLGVSRGQAIGILMERSLALHTAILAVQYLGAAYVPLDPKYPVKRLGYIVENAGINMILMDSHAADNWQEPVGQMGVRVLVDGNLVPGPAAYAAPASAPVPPLASNQPLCRATDTAYIIYTSGSTGNPKGVEIAHQSYLNFANWMGTAFEFGPNDRVSKFSTPTFDASMLEFMPALIRGSTLHILRQEVIDDLTALMQYLESQSITISFMPTQLAELLMSNHLDALGSLRILMTGGDKLRTIPRADAPCTFDLYNLYGPTEYTIAATYHRVNYREPVPYNIPIGRPIHQTQVLILDDQMNLVPTGTPGELCISGAGLAKGYLGQPELTREKFSDHPYEPTQKLYRTGDLARYLPDGSLEYLGRMDQQVKLRGYRIELGEIEATLMARPYIEEACVLCLGQGQAAQLVAMVVLTGLNGSEPTDVEAQEALEAQVKADLRGLLPHYMVPQLVVPLEKMPLNTSGKVDRKGLMKVAQEGVKGRTDGPQRAETRAMTGPESALEGSLLEIWHQSLGHEDLTVVDDFFIHGGHSLKAMSIINSYRERGLGNMTLAQFYDQPTVRQQALLLQASNQSLGSNQLNMPQLARRPQETYPLSYNQERIWLYQELNPESRAYNMVLTYPLEGQVDPDRVLMTFKHLAEAHEILRTTIGRDKGSPVQQILAPETLDWNNFQVVWEDQMALDQLVVQANDMAFDFAKAPLWHVALHRGSTPEENTTLVIVMHHLIGDGYSVNKLVETFMGVYGAMGQGGVSPLDQPVPLAQTLQYGDFALWQREYLGHEPTREGVLKLWQDHLLPQIKPFSYPFNPSLSTSNLSATYTTYIKGETMAKVTDLAALHHVTPFMVLYTLFNMALARICQTDAITCTVPSAGRTHSRLETMMGCLVNGLVIPCGVDKTQSFSQQLKAFSPVVLKAFEYEHFPIELVLDHLNLPYPKSAAYFNMLSFDRASGHISSFEPRHDEGGGEAKAPIACYVTPYANGFELRSHYWKNTFTPRDMAFVMDTFVDMVDQFSNNPQLSLSQYAMAQVQTNTGDQTPPTKPKLSFKSRSERNEIN